MAAIVGLFIFNGRGRIKNRITNDVAYSVARQHVLICLENEASQSHGLPIYDTPQQTHTHTLSLSLLLSKDTIISSVTLMVFITINMIPLFVYVINGESLITFKEVKINILL